MAFRALLTEKAAEGSVSSAVQLLSETQLPEGEVLVAVEWTGFNYKDALCIKGLGGLVRVFPHVGGIDFAGRVIESQDPRYHPGQGVILTGWRVGELVWGGCNLSSRRHGRGQDQAGRKRDAQGVRRSNSGRVSGLL